VVGRLFLICVSGLRAIEDRPPPDVPYAIVSIRTPGDTREVKLPTSALLRGVLTLSFYDLPDMPAETEAAVFSQEPHLRAGLFDGAMAQATLAFVQQHLAVIEALWVHCDAGLSRSPGLAAGLLDTVLLSQDVAGDRRIWHERGNDRVYRCLRAAWGSGEPQGQVGGRGGASDG